MAGNCPKERIGTNCLLPSGSTGFKAVWEQVTSSVIKTEPPGSGPRANTVAMWWTMETSR